MLVHAPIYLRVRDIRVKYENDNVHRRNGDCVGPVIDDQTDGHDFKGYESGFEDEEVVTGCDAEGFVDVSAGKSNEW